MTSVQAGTLEQNLHFWIFLGGRNEKAKAISDGAALIQPEMGFFMKNLINPSDSLESGLIVMGGVRVLNRGGN